MNKLKDSILCKGWKKWKKYFVQGLNKIKKYFVQGLNKVKQYFVQWLNKVKKSFCLSCTVPTQIIFKSYLIHQNNNNYSQQSSQAVPEGGSVKLSCKARGFPQWVSSTIVQNNFLFCSTIAQNIFLLCSTPAQNISLFCSTLAQNIFSLFSTLAQNRIFKFVHLMCKIEFLGWSKSCTKYNFCSTLAQKKNWLFNSIAS